MGGHNNVGAELMNCDFCDELSGGSSNLFASCYGRSADRTIWQSKEITIIPTIGQIVAGHVLIIPNNHITAFGDAPPSMLSQLIAVKASLREILLRKYGGCIFFEHGTRGSHCGGCGVYHAHIHAVPITYSFSPAGLLKSVPFFTSENLQSALSKINRESSYLFFENTLAECFIAEVSYVPSQTLRRAVAEFAGNPIWDWREYGFESELLGSWKSLRLEFECLL
jgi:diadenosine tetraphosphate (Ap4A) HIT family hydrolase